VSAGWFLTGEKVPYSGRQGNFLAPKILDSIADGGAGAFELLARHERLDYSRTLLGGTGEETTLGLNWYPVPLVRFMVNWSHWTTDNRVAPAVGRDTGDSITTRAQFNF
jgi:phosphate-selective porin OprO/OprP